MSIVLEGIVKADGTLELRDHPKLPPGPVRLTLEVAAQSSKGGEYVPDPPWLDESIPAPFDLPLPATPRHIQARSVRELLPAPFEWTAEDRRP